MSSGAETTLVAYLTIASEPGWCAYDLSDEVHVRSLLEEIHSLMDTSVTPGQIDSDEDDAFVTIEVRQKPADFVTLLPEFEGW